MKSRWKQNSLWLITDLILTATSLYLKHDFKDIFDTFDPNIDQIDSDYDIVILECDGISQVSDKAPSTSHRQSGIKLRQQHTASWPVSHKWSNAVSLTWPAS